MKSALNVSMKKEEPAYKKAKQIEEDIAEEAADDPNVSNQYDKYECENAVRTLHEAEEIKQNAALMKAIEPMLEKKSKAIKSLDDLRSVAKKMGDGSNRIQG